MIIGVAGPYTAATEEQQQANLDRMTAAAVRLLEKGHTPVIGVHAALAIVDKAGPGVERNQAIMAISLAVIDSCQALLLLAESPGANRERDLVQAKGLPVYTHIDDIGPA
ncbi:TIR domain-containing protein [Taibaiella koreensis]|uniref:DUF4406 domain-containing protein n=1 Tax=Taibaiella koreensis TaxID=1268548 RepID=UPI000E5994FC|nr:DUF4406 domain-containing protein [Taibaiella koreensis]